MALLSHSYVAGLFDGEGTVSAFYVMRRKRSGGAPIMGFRMVVGIANTHLGVLRKVEELYGGYVYAAKTRSRTHKTLHQWRITGADGQRRFLEAIHPYTVIKRTRVAAGLVYLGSTVRVGQRHTQAGWDAKTRAVRILKRLNQRGAKKPAKYEAPIHPPDGWRMDRRYTKTELADFMRRMRNHKKPA